MAQHLPNYNQPHFKAILDNYRNLRDGKSNAYIEEDGFEQIIQYYDSRSQNNKALEAATIAVNQFPYSSVLLINKADLLIVAMRYSEALETLEQAEMFEQNNINILILKTDIYLATDQQQLAINILQNALPKYDGTEKVELLFELADVFDDHEMFAKIFDCLQSILEIEPTNEEALYKICFWADQTKRNEESVTIHQKITDEYPFCELAWFNLGSAFQGLKLYEKAIDAYQFAIAIDEKFEYAYRNIGDALMRLKQFKTAIEYLQKVLELSKPEEIIYEAMGYCYEKLNQPAEARFYYKKSLHLNPENAFTYFKIAGTYMRQEQYKTAIKIMESGLKIKIKCFEFNFLMAQAYFQLDALQDAVFYLTKCLTQKPKSVKAWEMLMICLYGLQQYDDGLEYANKAIDTTDKTMFLYYKIAFLHALGYTKEAIVLLHIAMTKAPKQLDYLSDLEPSILHHPEFMFCIMDHL